MNAIKLQEKITKWYAITDEYEATLLALASGGIEQYTLDTGQTRQTITKINVEILQDALEAAYNLITVLEVRLNGGGTVQVRPGW